VDIFKTFIVGVVTIGLITAFGLHAQNLSTLATATGKAGQGLLSTAESGK